MRKNDILPRVTSWVELEGVTLSEISQTEEDKYCMISLICGIFKKCLTLWLSELVQTSSTKYVMVNVMYRLVTLTIVNNTVFHI